MDLMCKGMNVLVALQLDHFHLQAIAHMRVPPVCIFMSTLLSWRFFSVLDCQWGALPVSMQQLLSSRVRFIVELCSFSS